MDFQTAEKFILQNPEAKRLLPEYFHLFESYAIGLRTSRNVAKQAVIDLLQSLPESKIQFLNEKLKLNLSVEKVDFSTVKTFSFEISEDIEITEFLSNFCITRNETVCNILFWR